MMAKNGMRDEIVRLRAINDALETDNEAMRQVLTTITEHERDGYDACRYCRAEDYGVDEDGGRAYDAADVAAYAIDHEAWCPSAIIDAAGVLDEQSGQALLNDLEAQRKEA